MQTKNPTDPKPIQQVMGESTLGSIIKKAQILDKINHSLYELLSPGMREHSHVLNLKERCLILASHNSAIATQLRYREEELLKKLNQLEGVPEITRIDCVVRPNGH